MIFHVKDYKLKRGLFQWNIRGGGDFLIEYPNPAKWPVRT